MKGYHKYGIITGAVILMILVLACKSRMFTEFEGSKTEDLTHFAMDFSVLNTTYTHEMSVGKDECVEVRIKKEKGTLSLKIEKEEGEPIYQGDDVSSGDFVVFAEESGNYRFTVSGKRAGGKVSFQVKNNDMDGERY